MNAIRLGCKAVLAVALAGLTGCAAVVVGGAAAGGAVHDRRSFGTVIDDQALELAAFDAINHDKVLANENNIEAIAHNGTLLLIGEATTDDFKRKAEQMVKDLQGISRVVNELEVRPIPSATSAAKDRWLSLRVKSALVGIKDIKGFDATRVNVSTQRGIVYLMGLVTRAEADRASQVAAQIDGVKRVVRVFEFIDSQ